MPKESPKPKRRNIDPAEWVVKELSIEAIEKGFRGFKPYVEHLIEEHAKKRVAKKNLCQPHRLRQS